MNTKTLVGGLIGGVVAFLLGWLIFGMLLMKFYQSNMVSYSGLLKDPPEMWAIAVANLAYGLLLAYILNLGGIKSVSKGFTTGLTVGLLSQVGFDLLLHGQMNLYNTQLLITDIVASGIFSGIIAAIIGWWFGRGVKTAS